MHIKLPALLMAFLCICSSLSAQNKPIKIPDNKKAVLASVEKHQQELINLSDSVWKFAETALKESQSAKILAGYAEKNGFSVRRGVEIGRAHV